ncbi:NADPH oxidase 3, partial [Coemansia sp. RSA 2599]
SHGKVKLSTKLFGTTVGKTGHAILFLMFFLFITVVPVVRRRFHELFYWMHHLFVPITILIFVHGSATSFQWYLIGPGAIYVVDRLYRFCRSRFRHPRILSIIQHPSNVIEIKMERRGMKFEVGQYVYLNIPSISRLEWHPFTLTSAPEEDEISVHIWVAGDWTRRLVQMFQGCAIRTVDANNNYDSSSVKRPLDDMYMQSEKIASSRVTGLTDKLVDAKNVPSDPANMGTLKALADQELLMQSLRSETNPTSTLLRPGTRANGRARGLSNASSHHAHKPWAHGGRNSVVLLDRLPPEIEFRTSDNFVHATPVRIADDQPLMSLPKIRVDGPYGAPTQQVFDYEHIILIGGGIGVTPMSSVLKSLYYQLTQMTQQHRIKKVYFLWVCRDIQSLEWFQDLLLALDEEDIGDILEIRTYLTGQLSVEQIRNIALYQDPNGPDAVTGLYRSPTYYGRPNFDTIFENIGMRTPGADIGVFFCGPKPMGRTLRGLARKWTNNLSHMGTAFNFHKENF